MSLEAILEASRTGLDYERLRMDVASRNIARANVPLAPEAFAASGPQNFAAQLGGVENDSAELQATRAVHDPGHPLADAQGQVHYPAIDMVTEMTSLMTASRGYEANVRAFNLLRSMILRALEIGAK